MSALPVLFPEIPATGDTTLVLAAVGDRQPMVTWVGTATGGEDAASFAAVGAAVAGSALLPEQSSGLYIRPGLRGHRLAGAGAAAGAAGGSGAAGGPTAGRRPGLDARVPDHRCGGARRRAGDRPGRPRCRPRAAYRG